MNLSNAAERKLFSAFFLLIALFTALDIYEDLEEGAHLTHLIIEGSIILVTTVAALYLWKFSLRKLKSQNRQLSREVVTARKDAEQWKSSTATILAGLGSKIEEQFDQWRLSEAEKDVGLLLLKGFSHKEIASIRGTSEKTIRHQSAAIYKKTDLEGRSQLSAFFLEDLLLPSSKGEH